MPNSWITHLKAFYQGSINPPDAKNKGKMSYRQAMQKARASYKPKSKAGRSKKKK